MLPQSDLIFIGLIKEPYVSKCPWLYFCEKWVCYEKNWAWHPSCANYCEGPELFTIPKKKYEWFCALMAVGSFKVQMMWHVDMNIWNIGAVDWVCVRQQNMNFLNIGVHIE